jgi:GNAT superfamily N-acetyltransferase
VAARVDRHWARFFGVDAALLGQPGVHVVPHAQLADYDGVWLFRRGATCVVSAPPERLAELRERLAARSVAELGQRDAVSALFPGAAAVVGPAFHASVAPDCFVPHPDPEVRALGADDVAREEALRAACPAESWQDGGPATPDAPRWGCFREARLVALAHQRAWPGDACDVGVITHPRWRGRGCGTGAASAAVEAALAEGRLVLYQTLVANTAAVSLAQALGFDPYATHLAVRFR